MEGSYIHNRTGSSMSSRTWTNSSRTGRELNIPEGSHSRLRDQRINFELITL